MEVKHDIRTKMKKEIRAKEETEVKEHLIAVYNTMAEWGDIKTLEPPKTTPARLIIGYDKSKDISYLVVGAQYFGSDETWVLNEFTNEKADFVYDLLTNPRSIDKIKWENKNDKVETDRH